MDIVQGRYDVVCPATSAYELHQAVPHSNLTIIPDAGHSMGEVGIAKQLVSITDKYNWIEKNDNWDLNFMISMIITNAFI